MGVNEIVTSEKYIELLDKKTTIKPVDTTISDTFPEDLKPKYTDRLLEPPMDYEFPIKEVSTNVKTSGTSIQL